MHACEQYLYRVQKVQKYISKVVDSACLSGTRKNGKTWERPGIVGCDVVWSVDDWIRFVWMGVNGVDCVDGHTFFYETVDELGARRHPALIRADVACTRFAPVANQHHQFWSIVQWQSRRWSMFWLSPN